MGMNRLYGVRLLFGKALVLLSKIPSEFGLQPIEQTCAKDTAGYFCVHFFFYQSACSDIGRISWEEKDKSRDKLVP